MQNVFLLPAWMTTLLGLIIGLLVGSFLNVVIYRLPKVLFFQWKKDCLEFLEIKQNLPEEPPGIVFPRSHCPKCKALVKPWQNIPVLSYLLLKGKCANCSTPISLRYPIIELVTGGLTAFAVYHFSASSEALFAIFLTWSLITLTMIDVDHQILPDSITLPLMWAGLIINSFNTFTSLNSALFGAVFGYLSLWSFVALYKKITGKDGMGAGDFKLFAAFGAWMGWQMLLPIILFSSVVGAVVGIAGIIILGRDKNIPIPFGPYLAAAGWIAFYWGDSIVAVYMGYAAG